jgi:hypothetical protein
MNTISIGIISPHWDQYKDYGMRYVTGGQLSILIDGNDLFRRSDFENLFTGIDPGTFLYDECAYQSKVEGNTERLDGFLLIGICNDCFHIGCCDLYAVVSTEADIVRWTLDPDGLEGIEKTNYEFNKEDYIHAFKKLEEEYKSYKWEDKNSRIRRMCNEYIMNFKAANGKEFDGVRILNYHDSDALSKKMEIYYFDDWEPMGEKAIGRPFRSIELEWDGETLDSALNNLKEYAEKHLVRK